jgi:hypothetical protein
LSLEEAFPAEAAFVLSKGLMEYESECEPTLRLTPHGEMNYNGVIALFYARAVKAYLLSLEEKNDIAMPVSDEHIKANPLIYTKLYELSS